MFALAYASNAIHPFDENALQALAQHARQKNERLNVTGYLCFNNGVFFQYLEGERQTVLDLMSRIERDDRHKVVSVVHLEEKDERLFPHWNMRYLQQSEMNMIQLEHVLE